MDLSDLNPEQRSAVTHPNGPMLVVAGAGTGKTAVITRRVEWLIKNNSAKAEDILALTFTEKAAGEMLDRLDGLMGWDAYRVNVMTFHAFGGIMLRRFGHHLGWPTSTELIPEVAQLVLMRQHLSDINLSYYGSQNDLMDFLKAALDYIKALQNADIDVDKFRTYVETMANGEHPLDRAEAKDRLALFDLYEKIKRRYGVIDYHDQIKLSLQLLQQRPNLVDKLKQQYKYVLVDEYQDTNAAQDELLRILVPPGGNIFAVGDDDQAIYGFRGAKLSNILNFADHYKVKSPVVLTQNYRSGQAILDAAYSLIKHNNPDRLEAKLGLDKHLRGQSAGLQPVFKAYSSAREETESVADQVANCLVAGLALDQIAVLATSHAALKNMARSLRERGLPYQLSSSVNIFEQPEILQLWHLLKWIGMACSDEAVSQLLLGPYINWPSDQVRRLTELGSQQLISLEAALEQSAKFDKSALKLRRQLEIWRSWAKQMPVSQLAYRLVFESGLSEEWIKRAQTSPRMVRVFEDLQLWLQHMHQFESFATDQTLSGYSFNFPQPPEIEAIDRGDNDNGLALLTIHGAKGLEFETVFLINNTDDAWSNRSVGLRTELPEGLVKPDLELPPEHERRRLMYVAVTRAKTELILSAPVLSKGGGSRKLTPFLSEMLGKQQPVPPTEQGAKHRLNDVMQNIQRYAPKITEWEGDQLPFEGAGGWIELSTTEIEKYDRCPYEFYLEKVLKIRTPIGPQISFGSLLHELFKEYYQSRLLREPLTLELLNQRLTERWNDRGFRTASEAEASREAAQRTLKAFFDREEASERILRSSEEAFTLVLPESKLRIRGRIDASFETAGGVEVRDFKTGRKRDPEKLSRDAKQNIQLRTYALAVEEMTGKPPVRVVLDYVVSGVEGVAELSPTILRNHREKLGQIADRIRAREFEPNPDVFHSCVAQRYWGSGDDDESVEMVEALNAR